MNCSRVKDCSCKGRISGRATLTPEYERGVEALVVEVRTLSYAGIEAVRPALCDEISFIAAEALRQLGSRGVHPVVFVDLDAFAFFTSGPRNLGIAIESSVILRYISEKAIARSTGSMRTTQAHMRTGRSARLSDEMRILR